MRTIEKKHEMAHIDGSIGRLSQEFMRLKFLADDCAEDNEDELRAFYSRYRNRIVEIMDDEAKLVFAALRGEQARFGKSLQELSDPKNAKKKAESTPTESSTLPLLDDDE